MFEQQVNGEEYFSTISSPARKVVQDVVQIRNGRDKSWHDLRSSGGTEDAGLLISEGFEQPSSTIVAAPKAQKYHTLGSRSRNKNKHQKQQVRLSTFGGAVSSTSIGGNNGVQQVFPRLRIDSGQKKVTSLLDHPAAPSSLSSDANGSEENPNEQCLYATYRDEHSAPFSWMTKSQQELRFDSGTPEGDAATSGRQLQEEESVYAEGGRGGLRAPSATSSGSGSGRLQSLHHVRQSRGNPSYAKPVGIPQIPPHSSRVMSPTADHGTRERKVSPHRINNFVCETSNNRLVFDFGNPEEEVVVVPSSDAVGKHQADLNGGCGSSTGGGSESGRSGSSGSGGSSGKFSSTGGLLARMKQKTKSSIKRSLSTVSSKHKQSNGTDPPPPPPGVITVQDSNVATRTAPYCSPSVVPTLVNRDLRESSPTPTQSTLSNYSSAGSLAHHHQSSSIYGTLQRPSAPPPPPPPSVTKPTGAPPPPQAPPSAPTPAPALPPSKSSVSKPSFVLTSGLVAKMAKSSVDPISFIDDAVSGADTPSEASTGGVESSRPEVVASIDKYTFSKPHLGEPKHFNSLLGSVSAKSNVKNSDKPEVQSAVVTKIDKYSFSKTPSLVAGKSDSHPVKSFEVMGSEPVTSNGLSTSGIFAKIAKNSVQSAEKNSVHKPPQGASSSPVQLTDGKASKESDNFSCLTSVTLEAPKAVAEDDDSPTSDSFMTAKSDSCVSTPSEPATPVNVEPKAIVPPEPSSPQRIEVVANCDMLANDFGDVRIEENAQTQIKPVEKCGFDFLDDW